MTPHHRFTRCLGALVFVAALAGCSILPSSIHPSDSRVGAAQNPTSAASPTPPSPTAPSAQPLAATVLAGLEIKGRAAKTGYDREGQFGTAWFDVDRNGCDTRNDVLARDLTSVTTKGPCTVTGGLLADPYTASTVTFVRGNDTSTLVQIDHVVALMNAWQSGAQQLSPESRLALANDQLNLLAVDGATNSAKGAGDAATWLPPNRAFRCAYVARQVAVKSVYGLWVTPAEHEAMARVLDSCPGEPVPASDTQDAFDAHPRDSDPDVVYPNCSAVVAAGAAPLAEGDPGYSSSLDRDGDGIACE